MSVTTPAGFRASGVTAGLKASGRPDLAVVAADRPVPAAGVFTANRVQAAPVRWSRIALADGALQAVVLNSGGANACTGPAGYDDAASMAQATASALRCDAADVAVASTGLIGTRLPMELVLPGIALAVAALDVDGGADAARAIMTTDTQPKTAVALLSGQAAGVSVGGMAKGAGMLAPALATMLAVLTTDAAVSSVDLDQMLRGAVERTFDRIDTDGCMSTNDTVLLLASGSSGVEVRSGGPGWDELAAGVRAVCADLAEQLVDDAEGASKRITVEVTGAIDEGQAVAAARGIARSALLKCALHGEDPNWGRVLAALGTTSAEFDPDAVDVAFNAVAVCAAGIAAGSAEEAREALRPRDVTVTVDLHAGSATATILTTDLTAAYVHENSAYST